MSDPPKAGSRLSVRVDQELSDDLLVLMRAEGSASDAVRHAVSILASIYRNAWTAKAFPEGVRPIIEQAVLAPSATGVRRPTGAADKFARVHVEGCL